MASSFEDSARRERGRSRGWGWPRRGGGSGFLALSAREFLRNPMAVGSAFPASRHLVDAMLDPVDWSGMSRVIEYGPGTGIFTRALLERLPAHARLMAIDTSAPFIEHLRRDIRDSRLVALTGSADGVLDMLAAQGWGRADVILSGLPFSTLEQSHAERLMLLSARALSAEGMFLAYQMRKAVKPLLERRFASVEAGFEWRNIPPCHLYWARHPLWSRDRSG